MIVYVIAFVISFQGAPSYLVPKDFPQFKSMKDCMKEANRIAKENKDVTAGCLTVIPAGAKTST
jgi:hypothetical protein